MIAPCERCEHPIEGTEIGCSCCAIFPVCEECIHTCEGCDEAPICSECMDEFRMLGAPFLCPSCIPGLVTPALDEKLAVAFMAPFAEAPE